MGLGFEQPKIEGISKDGHAFLNIQNELVKVENILEEVEKRAYDDILKDDNSLRDSIFYKLSIHLIDLHLTHSKLIHWDQPSVLHVDEFPTKEALLRFMGVKMPHKKLKPPSPYVCKIDPKGYFGENTNSSCKERVDTNQKQGKVAKKAPQNNNPLEEVEHEDLLLTPEDF